MGRELEVAQKLINAWVQAVKFLRSGWLPAIAKLSYSVDRRDRRVAKGIGKRQGQAERLQMAAAAN